MNSGFGCRTTLCCFLGRNLHLRGKKPCDKINSVLREIKRIEDQKGFGDLLEMIRMPEEDVDEDGNLVLTGGMTYSDAEVLLEYYNSVIWFTQGDREMG